jgi:peroxiredoxin Q/BCP
MLKTGDKAPDFTATDHMGRTVTLDGLKGKTVVLWFYPEADTPGCTAEGCSFRDLAGDFEKKGARIYGVSFNNAQQNKAFAEKFHFNFPLLCDTTRTLGLAYGAADDAKATNAKRIGVVIGPDGRIKEWLPKVDAKTYPTEVLQRI